MRTPESTPDTGLAITASGHVRGPEIDRLGVDLVVKFGEGSGGRLVITSLEVAHPDGVTGNLIRQLPLARIERQKDRQTVRIRRPAVVQGAPSAPLSAAEQRALVKRMDAMTNSINETGALQRLNKMLAAAPDPARRRRLGEDFYELVAATYLIHMNNVTDILPTPSLIIARATGTPLPTVQGWVRRARLRGYLGPARQGRAG